MPSRFEVERAIRRSMLPAPARHVVLTLATYADASTGMVPPDYSPSLSTLAEATGLDRATVRRHLNRLEKAGWVSRFRPPAERARKEHARTAYALTIPPGLGAESPQPGGSVPLGLGAQDTGARGTEPPNQTVKQEIPPNPPQAGGTRCKKHKARPKAYCPDCQLPALAAVPAWCGECDQDTRQIEQDDGRVARCPACHPLHATANEEDAI